MGSHSFLEEVALILMVAQEEKAKETAETNAWRWKLQQINKWSFKTEMCYVSEGVVGAQAGKPGWLPPWGEDHKCQSGSSYLSGIPQSSQPINISRTFWNDIRLFRFDCDI